MKAPSQAEKPAPQPATLSDAPVSRRPITVAEGLRWLLALATYPKEKEWGRMSPAALALGVLIRERYARQEGYARFSLEHAEAMLGYSRASLSAAVRDLVKAGFIERVRDNRRHSNEYVMKFDVIDDVERYVHGSRVQMKSRQMTREIERKARVKCDLAAV